MKVTATSLPDVLLFEPKVFGDERGFFMESFNQRVFEQAVGRHFNFVQDNHSRSTRGVLRGLHCQLPPHPQGKLVRVAAGRIFDVAVDARPDSPTVGQWVGLELDGSSHQQLWIPPGFIHGFVALSETVDVLYKSTDFYAPSLERSVLWNDAALGIKWPLQHETRQISDKDAKGIAFVALIEELRALSPS